MGQLELWVSTNKGAPRKTAHINRRRMLITDARLFGTNPFYPSGGAGWPDWCAVTMAHDESTEAFIRRMEPPAHDAIHFRQLRERDQQRAAEFEVRAQRDQITQIIKARIDDALLDASNNVDELARLFPDVPDLSQGVHALKWRDRQHTERSNDVVDLVDTSDENEAVEDPDGDLEIELPSSRDHERKGGGGGDGDGEGNFDEPEIRKASPKPSEHAIRLARIMRVAPSELVMTFTTPSQPSGPIRFGIKAAGEQYQKHEESISITGVKQVGSLLAKATPNGHTIEVTAPPDTPVTLTLALDTEGAPYLSYSIVQIQQQTGKP